MSVLPPEPSLYDYWRSSACYRVRIVLNLKGIAAKQIPVNLRAGEQSSEAHKARNPAGLVPLWHEADGFTLAQSLAIIAYLDELHPDPPLLPPDPRLRALCREIALTIACDIHPLGNLRVQEKLKTEFGAGEEDCLNWLRHWMRKGFDAVEARLAGTAGRHAMGSMVSLADVCLIPQVYNACRFGLDLAPYPKISAVDAAAQSLPAFAAAAPEAQPDAPPEARSGLIPDPAKRLP